MKPPTTPPTPTAARLTSFTHDGLVFDVTDEGPVDGDVVVLLHGFPERATCWRSVAPLLHARGYRTIAPDQRGYSPGARPPRRRDYRITHLVADVAALVEQVGAPVHLVGHDWGAVVAWSVAATHPALLRSLTALSVPPAGGYLRAMVTGRQLLRSWYVGAFQVPGLAERLAGPGGRLETMLRASGQDADEVARFRRDIVQAGALPGALGWYRAVPLGGVGDPRARVTVPTTMVWSTGDGYIDRAGVLATARLVDAPYRLVELEGVSHWMCTEAPRAVADAVLERMASATG